MGVDDGWIRGVDAGDASTFLCLVEYDVDGADQGVGEMKWCDVFRESTEFLEVQ